MNVVVCVKQIPDPAVPGVLAADHTLDRAVKLILDESDSYGVEMALQLVDAAGDGEVTLVSMVPNGEVSGLRTALAMGAAKAILVSDEALHGSDALSTAKVLARCVERAGGIDLVLTATEATDGYTGTVPAQIGELLGWPSLTFAKHIEVNDGKVTIQRQTEAGYDVVEASLPAVVSVTAGVVEPALPVVQRNHGREEQAGRRGHRGRSRVRRVAGRLGRRASGDRECRTGAGPSIRREVRRRRDRRREDRRVPRAAEGGLTVMVDKIWVFAESADGKATSATLELCTKARELASTVQVCYAGSDVEAVAASAGEYGASTLFAIDPGDGLPGQVAAAAIAQLAADHHPDAMLFAQSYDGRDTIARLSVKLDRPVLTNGMSLSDDNGLVFGTAIFGGVTLVDVKLTGGAPALIAIRPKSFAAESAGGNVAAIEPVAAVDAGRAAEAKVLERHVEEQQGPKLEEASVVVSGGRGIGAAENYAPLVEALARELKGAWGASPRSSTPAGCRTRCRSARPARP